MPKYVRLCCILKHSRKQSDRFTIIRFLKDRVINSVTKEGTNLGATLFLEVIFYQSKSQRKGRATVREAKFLFPDV